MHSLKISLKTILFSLLLASLFLVSCKDDEDMKKTEFTGEKVALGDGHVWSFVKTDDAGEPLSIGIKFDEKALQNLPTGHQHGHSTVLKMPKDKALAPFDHITFDWNEHGHEPDGVYNIPHFDCHFYLISTAAQNAIGPFDTVEFRKPLAAEYMPPLYLDTNEGVPAMGVHLVDLTSPEIAGTGTFTKTFIYGKYDGQITFLEPMLTLDYIKSKPTGTIPIRQPEKFAKNGSYPTNYAVRYDASKKEYSITMGGLKHFHQ
jgi:hypothetical protein